MSNANDFKLDSHRRVSIKSCNMKINDGPCNFGQVMGIKPKMEGIMNEQEVKNGNSKCNTPF